MAYRLENNDIVIDGWENGISDNPYTGIFDMRNVDPSTVPGEVSVAMKTETMYTQASIATKSYTVDAGTDVFTYDGIVPLEVNTAIYFVNSGGAVPAGLTAYQKYYIKTIPTPTTFTISTSAGGTQQLVTDTGSGTNTFNTCDMGVPVSYTKVDIPNSDYKVWFCLDSNSRVWVLNTYILSGGTTNKWVYCAGRYDESTNNQLGLFNICGWKGYLFATTATSIVCKRVGDPTNNNYPSLSYITSSADNFISSWTVITSSWSFVNRPIVVDPIDGNLRFGLQNTLGSLLQIAGKTFHPTAGAVSAADGATTNGSTTITTTTNFFTSSMVGSVITGTGIPAGAIITARTSSKIATISDTATASNTGLTFTVPTSWTFNASSLTLQNADMITSLEFQGQSILIGALGKYIYPWDRISLGYTTPIYLSENFTQKMVTVNTTTYVFCGYKGRIYQTNGSNVSFYKQMPQQLSKTVNPYYLFSDAVYNRNKLYFGVQCFTNAGVVIPEYGGLWCIDLETDALFQVDITTKNTTAGFVSSLLQYEYKTQSMTMPLGDGYGLMIGWTATNSVSSAGFGSGYISAEWNGSSPTYGGTDKGISVPYSGGESYIVSDLIPVGQLKTKRTFENLEYKLSTPLVSGESVTLSYRTDINSAFTDVPITSGGGVGDVSGLTDTVNFENAQWVQIKATMTSTSTTPSFVRIKEIRIR